MICALCNPAPRYFGNKTVGTLVASLQAERHTLGMTTSPDTFAFYQADDFRTLARRPVLLGRGQELALRVCGWIERSRQLTYAALAQQVDRWAALFRQQGLQPGEPVAVMTGKRTETIFAALALWQTGGVYCPIFADLGPDPVLARLLLGKISMVVTDATSYRRAILPIRRSLPDLRAVLIVGSDCPLECVSVDAVLPQIAPDATLVDADPTRPICIHFTSGTTAPHAAGGQPKAVQHDSSLLARAAASAHHAFALQPGEGVWCTGEPGWVTNTIYGIIAPLALAATIVLDPAPMSPTRCLSVLEDEPVAVWYTTPTVIRSLIGGGCAPARSFRPCALRLAVSVGEPLSADAVAWGKKALGVPFRDSWWQTETGAIVLSHDPNGEPRPGSMGRPQPDVTVAVMRRCLNGHLEQVEGDEITGELAVQSESLPRWSSVGGEAAALPEELEGWHLSGDIVRRDAEGYFWFLGREDEVIKSAARMVGPFEIEAVLMEHPAVAECGVVGAPDPVLHEHGVAFIALHPGFAPNPALRDELFDFARDHLGHALMPQDIRFQQDLPRTPGGKIIRRMLKGWV